MSNPVYIYWLLDLRPETIAAGHHSGYPFYCGKTINAPERRLRGHQRLAYRKIVGKLAQRLIDCGRHVRIEVVKIVPAGDGWEEQERRWIALTRFSFPDNCNTADGGQSGLAGYEMTREQRRKHRSAILSSDRCVEARLKRAFKEQERQERLERLERKCGRQIRKDLEHKFEIHRGKRVLVPRNSNYTLTRGIRVFEKNA